MESKIKLETEKILPKNKAKKLTSLLLAVMMVAGLFAVMPMTANAATSLEVGDTLYFGTYDGEPILWRVTAVGDGEASLLSEYILISRQWYHSVAGVYDAPNLTFATSTLGVIMRNLKNSCFTAEEQAAIKGDVTLPIQHAGIATDRLGVIRPYWLAGEPVGIGGVWHARFFDQYTGDESMGYVGYWFGVRPTLIIKMSPKIKVMDLPLGVVGQPYSVALELESGNLPVTWRAVGPGGVVPYDLPANLKLDKNTGIISSIPKEKGTFIFMIQAENDFGVSVPVSFLFEVGEAPEIITTSLPTVAAGTEYNEILEAIGDNTVNTPMTWSIVKGSLPSSITLNPTTGILSGTPNKVETATFVVRVQNRYGYHEKELSIEIIGVAPLITTTFANAQFPDATVGTPYPSVAMSAIGTQPISWSASGLPAGMWINEIGGTITGLPNTVGLKFFSVTATNAYGSHTMIYQISVIGTPEITNTEFLQSRAVGIIKAGLSANNLRLDGKTLTLVVDGREFVLSTNANNRNISGEIVLDDGYYLKFDIKGNGSNIKQFEIVRK